MRVILLGFVGVLLSICVMGICGLLLFITGDRIPSDHYVEVKPTTSPLFDPYRAATECEYAVRDRLVSPSSAVFASYGSGEEVSKVNNEPDSWHYVSSYVDSKNKLGVIIRTHYECVIINNGHWEIERLNTF